MEVSNHWSPPGLRLGDSYDSLLTYIFNLRPYLKRQRMKKENCEIKILDGSNDSHVGCLKHRRLTTNHIESYKGSGKYIRKGTTIFSCHPTQVEMEDDDVCSDVTC